jgi:hypothetical protein
VSKVPDGRNGSSSLRKCILYARFKELKLQRFYFL